MNAYIYNTRSVKGFSHIKQFHKNCIHKLLVEFQFRFNNAYSFKIIHTTFFLP